MRFSLVLWDGVIGGAERFSISLAGELCRRGAQANVVFIGNHDELRPQLQAEGVAACHMGFSRGAKVLLHPLRLAAAIKAQRSDVVIVGGFGYLGAAVRAGGFRGPLIGVEHGALTRIAEKSVKDILGSSEQIIRRLDRVSGVVVHDAEIAVSAFMERLARGTLHGRRLVRIAHGTRIAWPPLDPPDVGRAPIKLGYAGRLIPGKGLDVLLRALALLPRSHLSAVTLSIAGQGPVRGRLEALASRLDIGNIVSFIGWTDDMRGFWSQCHLAIAPNDTLDESFCMSIAEAMSCTRPVIVTNRGALPELVRSHETGIVVQGGEPMALASAIASYLDTPEKIPLHGSAARSWAERHCSLERCADHYLALSEALVRRTA